MSIVRKIFFLPALLLFFTPLLFSQNLKLDKKNTYSVVRVIDGDTFSLSNGMKIRLIGVDTPESANNFKLRKDVKKTGLSAQALIEMGKQAKNFTSELIKGKEVTLEYDIALKDRYGRILAYAYLEDNTFINAEIIKQGYGQVMTIPPNVKYVDLFLGLQKEAREKRKGFWSKYGNN